MHTIKGADEPGQPRLCLSPGTNALRASEAHAEKENLNSER